MTQNYDVLQVKNSYYSWLIGNILSRIADVEQSMLLI